MLRKVSQRLLMAMRVLLNGRLPNAPRSELRGLTSDEVEEAQEVFPRAKFFVFGHARSGTTLLARLVRAHPEVHCNWQAHFFTRSPFLQSLVADPEVEEWLSRRSNRWNRGRDLSPVVLRAVGDFILEREAHREGKRIVGDKSPNNLVHGEAVRLMHKVYPDARLIFIVRDGRDAVISHRFQTFIDGQQHLSRQDWDIRDAFSRNPEPFLRGERSVFTPQGLRVAAEDWVHNVSETEVLGRNMYPDRFYTLRFEDLTSKPWDQMRLLWTFLEVKVDYPGLRGTLTAELADNPDRVWQQQEASDLVQPLPKGKSGAWKTLFTPQDRQIFKDIGGEQLIKWGYEVNMDW